MRLRLPQSGQLDKQDLGRTSAFPGAAQSICICSQAPLGPAVPFLTCWDPAHILIIEATSPAGGVPVLPEGVGELLVQGVSKASGDALPGQDEDDDHGVLAVVACPVPHEAEQLLLQRVPADHLQDKGQGRCAVTHSSPAPLGGEPHPLTSAGQTWGVRTGL